MTVLHLEEGWHMLMMKNQKDRSLGHKRCPKNTLTTVEPTYEKKTLVKTYFRFLLLAFECNS